MAEVLVVKLKEKGFNGPGCIKFKTIVDIKNSSNLALLFSDLELHGANIPKAYEKFSKEKSQVRTFPW